MAADKVYVGNTVTITLTVGLDCSAADNLYLHIWKPADTRPPEDAGTILNDTDDPELAAEGTTQIKLTRSTEFDAEGVYVCQAYLDIDGTFVGFCPPFEFEVFAQGF